MVRIGRPDERGRMKTRFRVSGMLAAVTAAAAIGSAPAQAAEPPETVYGVVDSGGVETLARTTTTTGTVTTIGPIGGLGIGEKIVSMDFRPATGQLYALTTDDEINVISGIATATPTATPFATVALAGAGDIDFNPVPDAIRVVGENGENIRIPVSTGAVIIDSTLNGSPTGAAYTNAVAGSQQTTLYDIDSNALYLQGGLQGSPSPNSGALTQVNSLSGLTSDLDDGGFDISPNSGRAITLRNNAGTRQLYDVSLKSATLDLGPAPSDQTFHAIAIQPAVAALSFTAAAGSVSEDGGSVVLTVRRVGNINLTPSFSYTVAGSGANPAGAGDFGTATPAGPIQFAAGETTKTITVPITDDELDEANETFTVTLTAPSGGVLGTPAAQTVTIFDQDAPVAAVGEGETAYAVDGANQLLTFDTAAPATVTTVGAITGVDGTVLGIDIQPATGRLFAVTSASKVYVVDKATAAATQIGSAAFTPGVAGARVGLDFNPVPGAIRLLADSQSLRISPVTGAVAGTDSAPAATVAGAAYTNSVSGAEQSTLYVIDSGDDQLKRIGGLGGVPSPNGGAVTVIGALGVPADDETGFDISGATNIAYATLNGALHRIDLGTGRATVAAQLGAGNLDVRDIAIAANPPSVRFAAGAVSVKESAGTATVTVTRSGSTDGVSNVTVSTTTIGTATDGSDYTALSAQPVQFAAGETSKTVAVPILDDGTVEDSETIGVSLALAPASPGASLATPNAATITVIDDDPETVTNTVTNTNTVTVTVPGAAPKADQALLIAAPSSLKRASLLKGLRLRSSCAETCVLRYTLKLGSRTLGTVSATINGRGVRTVTLRLTSAGRRALTSAFRKRSVRSRRLTLSGTATDSDGGRPASSRVTVTVTR